MNFEFKELSSDAIEEFTRYSMLRSSYMSESQFINQFIWSGYYKTVYHCDSSYLFCKIEFHDMTAAMMPLCKSEDIIHSFFEIKSYFNQVLHIPLNMYYVDKQTLSVLQNSEQFESEFSYSSDRDCFDYLYDAEKLKSLSGRVLHKKKNHLNAFIKNYEGRFEYRTLCCSDKDYIKQFHLEWIESRKISDTENFIESEEYGIFKIFENCSRMNSRMGGIYIDGRLSAYSIGSYSSNTKCAFIHVEKADPSINGLYAFINQQFLVHEFPDALWVNREDDLGREGLRKSKLSYNPVELIEKYHIVQN